MVGIKKERPSFTGEKSVESVGGYLASRARESALA